MNAELPKGVRQLMHIIALNPDKAYLMEKGFRYVGGGHFSTVYGHPVAPGFVFKVNQDYNRYVVDSDLPSRDGYGPFADYVMARFAEHGDCPYLPRILSKVKSTAGRTVWCIEQLTPGNDAWGDYCNSGDHDLALSVANRVLCIHDPELIEAQRDLIEEEYPGLLEVLTELRQLGLDINARPDLHGRNYMVRNSGEANEEFVITDPFSFIRHSRVRIPTTRLSTVQALRNKLAWAERGALRDKRLQEEQEAEQVMSTAARSMRRYLFAKRMWDNPKPASAPKVQAAQRGHRFPAFVSAKPRRWAAG